MIGFYRRVLAGDEDFSVGEFPSGDEHAVVHAVGVGSSQVYVSDVALHGDGAGEHSDISVTQQSVSQGADDSG
jgi:hypothetical protein